MGDRPVRVLEVDERDVGDRRNDASSTQRADVRRPLAEPVAEDREVVWPEVPGDADIRLVEAEVDPARRDEVEVPELARFDQIANRDDRRAVEERVSGHDHEPALVGEADQLDALVRGSGERLLDEDVLAGLECCACRVGNASTPASRWPQRRRCRSPGCPRSARSLGRLRTGAGRAPGGRRRSRRPRRPRSTRALEDSGRGSGPSTRARRPLRGRRSRGRLPLAEERERGAEEGAGGRGRATIRERRRRPSRALRRRSSWPGR